MGSRFRSVDGELLAAVGGGSDMRTTLKAHTPSYQSGSGSELRIVRSAPIADSEQPARSGHASAALP